MRSARPPERAPPPPVGWGPALARAHRPLEGTITQADHGELAGRLAEAAGPAERTDILDTSRWEGVELARALKDEAYGAWGRDPARAGRAAAALAELTARDGRPAVAALAAWTGGVAALAAGQMEEAIGKLTAAHAGFSLIGDAHSAALTSVPQLMALAMLGRYDEALAIGLAARDTLLAQGDAAAAGRVELNLGNIHFRRDRYAAAEGFYRAALARFQALGDAEYIERAASNLADALAWQYQIREAALLYDQALRIAQAEGLEADLASIERNLGNLALFQGQYDQALAALERARRRYAALGLDHELALTELELADAYLELNLIEDAAAIYARVRPTFAGLGMAFEQAWAAAHHGRACALLSRADQARQLFSEAGQIFAQEGNAVWAALVGLAEGQLLARAGDYAAAEAALAQAEPALAQAGNHGQLALLGWLRGEVARLRGDGDRAGQLLAGTLREAERWRLPQIAQRCHSSLGLLAAQSGDRQAAEVALRQAIALTEELRAPLPAEEFRAAFFADKLAPYAAMVRLCLDQAGAGRLAEALGYVEQARSRALLDMLGGAPETLPRPRDEAEAGLIERLQELRAALNWLYNQIDRPDEQPDPAQIAALQADVAEREAAVLEIERQLRQSRVGELARGAAPLDLAALQGRLGRHTALVEYFSLDGELLAFIVTGAEIRLCRGLAQEAEVEAAVGQLRFQTDALRHGSERLRSHLPQLTRRANHYLGRLYDLLLRPIEPLLGDRRLAVVAHRALHYVPFQALYDGAAYLIERREVAYAPSAGVLQHCLERPERPLGRALLLGVPDARAPLVRAEVAAIAPLFPSAALLLDGDAGVAALRREAPGADLLHMACHGQFRPDSPLFSSLLLGDGRFTVRDAYGLDLDRCGLVTLSACQTGLSALAPGDELIGLARGFFAAGAPTLLVSLWTVDDASTADLMVSFYRRLLAGARPAAALRAAQLEQIGLHPHPFFWAPFAVHGRW